VNASVDLREILSSLGDRPSVAQISAAASRLRQIEPPGLVRAKIAVLRDTTLEQLIPFLEVNCVRVGVRPEVYMCPYGAAHLEVHNPQSELYTFEPEIIILAFRLENLAPKLFEEYLKLSASEADQLAQDALDQILNLTRIVRKNSKAILLVHNFETPRFPAHGFLDGNRIDGQINRLRRLNLQFAESLAEIETAFVVDIDHILSQIGYEAGTDNRFWHIARLAYSPLCLNRISGCYTQIAAALKGRNKKCLVLDCDNTLWGGVVGESGVSGIQLGAAYPGSGYRAFQLAVLELFDRGILLALNSKNNLADVLEVLNTHPDCLLKPGHFACMQVNWRDKASNLREIASELNLGLDSLVFVDDNQAECELVRRLLPEVLVVELGKDSTGYEIQLKTLGVFDSLATTAEDSQRSKYYQTEEKRKELRIACESYEAYLRSLEMVLSIERGGAQNRSRIAQLTQKTNQFNLTTRRYSEAEIQGFLDDPSVRVYSARLSDKFGDNGLIGVAIVKLEAQSSVIDSLLLSCRVINRKVEDALLSVIIEDAKEQGAARVIGQFIPTAKNKPAADFYSRQGFTPIGAGEYELPLEEGEFKPLPCFKNIEVK